MIVVFRHRPLVWLISSSTIAYLAVMTVPLLAIPYIYLTYFEILHIPVRNLIWFVYMLAGAVLYIVAVALAGIDRTKMSLVVVGDCRRNTGASRGAHAQSKQRRIFRAADCGIWIDLCLRIRRTPARTGTADQLIAGIVALLALVALWPDRAPLERSDQVTVRWTTGLSDERRVALERAFSLQQPERKTDAGREREQLELPPQQCLGGERPPHRLQPGRRGYPLHQSIDVRGRSAAAPG